MAVAAAVGLAVAVPRPDGGEGGWGGLVLPQARAASIQGEKPAGGRLAIVIDDFGQGRDGVRQMLALDCPLTLAVLPHGTFTREDAEEGHRRGFEVIVHIPMEPVHGKASWLGDQPILCSQQDTEIRFNTASALDAVPFAVGANIHMGSRASADERVMRCVLGEVSARGLFFLDSRTGTTSVVPQVAQELGVPLLSRNVFLDGQRPQAEVEKQLRLAGKLALEYGSAIAIGHVGIEGGKPTAQAIANLLPEFEAQGVQLVYLSELLTAGEP